MCYIFLDEYKMACFAKDAPSALVVLIVVSILIFFMLNHVIERFKQDDPKLFEIRQKLRRLHPDIVDGLVLLEDQKSYTINKKKVFLCIRDENGDYYHDNMLMFVAIHELAHVMCDEIGHTEKFERIFQELLSIATEHGIYDPSIHPIHNYCEY